MRSVSSHILPAGSRLDASGTADRGGLIALPAHETAVAKQPFTSSPAAACEFALVTERADFDALEEQWNALFERAGRPCQLFQTFNWLWHWANHYLGGRTGLSIVIGRRESRLVVVWPLIAMRVAGLTQLSWMGEPVSQYGDVLVENGADALDLLRESWRHVKSLGADVICLHKTRSDAAVSSLLAETGMVVTGCSAAPYLDFLEAADFESFRKRYSAKKRASTRRHLRRLEKVGSIGFEQHGSGNTARALVGRALALKRAWLLQRGRISSVLQDPRFDRFLGDLALDSRRSPDKRICAIRCNGEPVAIEISFACKGEVCGGIISHDLAFEKFGLGVLLAEFSIRSAREHGYGRFDFLPPEDAYKMAWANASVAVMDWALPLSFAGALYQRAWLGCARHWAKMAARGLPRGLGRMLSAIYGWSARAGFLGNLLLAAGCGSW